MWNVCFMVSLCIVLSCGPTLARAASQLAECPLAVSIGAKIPAQARLMGRLPEKSVPLWVAVLSQGSPEDVEADRGLADREPDDEANLGSAGTKYTWSFRSGPRPFMLVCRYGTSVADSLANSEQVPLLLIPLPRDASGVCDVQYPRAGADRKARPVLHAI